MLTTDSVIKDLQEHAQETLVIDPTRESADASVLISAASDDPAGDFSIWVFKKGVDPSNYNIGDIPVPIGENVVWGKWNPLDAAYLPGQGTKHVLRRYGNAVLDYQVPVNEWKTARLGGGFRLLDETLASLSGTKQWEGSWTSRWINKPLTPGEQASVHRAVQTLVLQLTDLGASYTRIRVVHRSNAVWLAEKNVCGRSLFGRLDGFEADYALTGFNDELDSYATVYKTALGAHQSLEVESRCLAHVAPRWTPLISVRNVGDETRLFYYRAALSGGIEDEYALIWRSGSAKLELDEFAASALHFNPADLVVIASGIQRARIGSTVFSRLR